MAIVGSTAPFMVMLTDIRLRSILSNKTLMSSTLSTETPAMPTSPTTRSWSLSYPRWVARSNATLSPCCPPATFFR